MTLADQFAANLKQARDAQGISQERLAERLNLSARYLRSMEKGTINIRLDILERIAKALHMAPCELLCPKKGSRS